MVRQQLEPAEAERWLYAMEYVPCGPYRGMQLPQRRDVERLVAAYPQAMARLVRVRERGEEEADTRAEERLKEEMEEIRKENRAIARENKKQCALLRETGQNVHAVQEAHKKETELIDRLQEYLSVVQSSTEDMDTIRERVSRSLLKKPAPPGAPTMRIYTLCEQLEITLEDINASREQNAEVDVEKLDTFVASVLAPESTAICSIPCHPMMGHMCKTVNELTESVRDFASESAPQEQMKDLFQQLDSELHKARFRHVEQFVALQRLHKECARLKEVVKDRAAYPPNPAAELAAEKRVIVESMDQAKRDIDETQELQRRIKDRKSAIDDAEAFSSYLNTLCSSIVRLNLTLLESLEQCLSKPRQALEQRLLPSIDAMKQQSRVDTIHIGSTIGQDTKDSLWWMSSFHRQKMVKEAVESYEKSQLILEQEKRLVGSDKLGKLAFEAARITEELEMQRKAVAGDVEHMEQVKRLLDTIEQSGAELVQLYNDWKEQPGQFAMDNEVYGDMTLSQWRLKYMSLVQDLKLRQSAESMFHAQ